MLGEKDQMRNTLTSAQRSRERVNWRKIEGKINKTWWPLGASGKINRGINDESEASKSGNGVDRDDINRNEESSASNRVSEIQQEKESPGRGLETQWIQIPGLLLFYCLPGFVT